MVVGILIAVVLLALIAWQFNRLVRRRNHVRQAWADVDALLQRRADLVPRLAAVVQGYREAERAALVGAAEARSLVAEARGRPPDAERARAEHVLGTASRSIRVVVEGHPELRAAEATGALFRELVETEDRLGVARMVYNRTVEGLNTSAGRFPGLLVARAAGIGPEPFFEAGVAEREPVA